MHASGGHTGRQSFKDGDGCQHNVSTCVEPTVQNKLHSTGRRPTDSQSTYRREKNFRESVLAHTSKHHKGHTHVTLMSRVSSTSRAVSIFSSCSATFCRAGVMPSDVAIAETAEPRMALNRRNRDRVRSPGTLAPDAVMRLEPPATAVSDMGLASEPVMAMEEPSSMGGSRNWLVFSFVTFWMDRGGLPPLAAPPVAAAAALSSARFFLAKCLQARHVQLVGKGGSIRCKARPRSQATTRHRQQPSHFTPETQAGPNRQQGNTAWCGRVCLCECVYLSLYV